MSNFKFTFGCGVLFVFLFFASVSRAENIASINIHMAEGSKKTTEAEVLRVIPIKSGDEFTSQNIDKAVDFFRKWGVFETINVGTSYSKSGVNVDFYLKEAILIGQIDISGNYPFVQQKIKKYLTIHVGDIFIPSRLEEQIKRIKDFYDREGILNTKVTSSESLDEKNDDVKILFKIKRGATFRYRDIVINETDHFSRGRIISAINPLFPYKPRAFNDAIRLVQDFYRKRGFPKARIEVIKRDLDFEKNKIDIELRVTEGPKVQIAIEGNNHISSAKLKKVLTIFEEGSFEEYEIEASIDALLDFYHKNGFPETSINHEIKHSADGSVIIKFNITEGVKQRIKKIKIEGNERISARVIQKHMLTKPVSLTDKGIFDKKILEADSESIKDHYASQGFMDATVKAPVVKDERGGVDITIPIEENEQTIVDNIIISGNRFFTRDDLLKKIKNMTLAPFDPTVLEQDRQNLLTFYADRGHPYAEINFVTVVVSPNHIVIKYDIKEGHLVKIGQVLVIGNSLTSAKAIKKTIPIHEGDVFNYQKITESQMALRRLGSFNSVNIETIGLTEREKTVHIRIKVEEQKPFIMDFEVNYSTDRRITGSANFTNLNTFGMTKRSGLKLTGGQELSRTEIFWTDPRFIGSDFEFTVAPWFQYENRNIFTFLQAGGGFGFFRKYHRTGILAKYEVSRNYFVEGDSNAADDDSLRDTTISKVAMSVSFDTRNSYSEPTRGIFAMMNSDLYNEIRGKEANFVKLRWSFGNAFGFLKYLTISNSARLGTIQEIGDNVSVPTNELFLMGGDDTLRGFGEDSLGPVNASGSPTGGRVRLIYNGELRIKIFGNWRLAGFYDTGALVNKFSAIDLDTIRQSTGFGLRYMTPVGPIRLDYGIILDQKPTDHFGRLHFTFGYVF